MPEIEAKKLDREILSFIRNYSRKPAPDSAFDALAIKLFKFQFRKNSNYRKFCLVQKKTLKNVRCWREIPALPAAGFKELVLTTFPAENAVRIFKTSGTTQNDTGAHFFDTLKLYEAAIIPPFRQYLLPDIKTSPGFQPDTRSLLFCYLIHSPKEAPHSSLSCMAGIVDEALAGKKGSYYVKSGVPDYERLAKDLGACSKKAFLLATSFLLKGFLDYLTRRRLSIKLSAGSRIMETGGLKGRTAEIPKSRLYHECEKVLGIKADHCVSEYGMTELSSQFYDTALWDKEMNIKRKPFKIGPAWTRTLVINPQTGKRVKKGSVRILNHFDLANRGSVLAIQTEDLGREAGEGLDR